MGSYTNYSRYPIPGYTPPKSTSGSTTTKEEEKKTPEPVVILPEGVDPFYGITLTNLVGGGTPATTTTTGAGTTTPTSPYTSRRTSDPYSEYLKSLGGIVWGGKVLPVEGALSREQFYALQDSLGGGQTTTTTPAIPGASGKFQIARPNMTFNNSLPSIIPSNGQAMATKYGPSPFSREANTPGVTYTKPPLTYNNPYNTNPYLPLVNPFALIANNSGSTNV